MADPVPGAFIETIVGADRHPLLHLGRMSGRTGDVFILHSHECADRGDLVGCEFSVALDNSDGTGLDRWEPYTDQVVVLRVVDGQLFPAEDL